MGNPSFYGRGKVLGDLLIRTHLSVDATLAGANEENPLELGTPVIVEAAEDNGYTAVKAEANEANGVLLQTTNNANNSVGVLIMGEISEAFYTDAPLSKALRTSLLQNGIILR